MGEDATFDVEFAAKYGARVIIVDPTPSASTHFGDLSRRIGMAAEHPYAANGRQRVTAYDLTKVKTEQLVFVDKALWTERTSVKFFLPKNRHSLSHSIVNFQNCYATDTAHIFVETMTLPELLTAQAIPDAPPLLKLDIEGAEVPVLLDMLARGFFPKQILVEFDELNVPSRRARENFDRTDAALAAAGYEMIHFDGRANFGYRR